MRAFSVSLGMNSSSLQTPPYFSPFLTPLGRPLGLCDKAPSAQTLNEYGSSLAHLTRGGEHWGQRDGTRDSAISILLAPVTKFKKGHQGARNIQLASWTVVPPPVFAIRWMIIPRAII
jgi:hypothetical protein